MKQEMHLKIGARIYLVAFIVSSLASFMFPLNIGIIFWFFSFVFFLTAVSFEREANGLWWNEWYRKNAELFKRQKELLKK